MPAFEVSAPDGRKFRVEGEQAPSKDDLDKIFSSEPRLPKFEPSIALAPEQDGAEPLGSLASPIKGFARGMRTAGEALVAGTSDLGNIVFRPVAEQMFPEQAEPGAMPLENIQALSQGERLPATDLRTLPRPLEITGRAAQGLLETAPRMAAITALQAGGVPAPIGAAAVFGPTEEGFSVKQAAIAAALPFVGKYSGAMVESLAGKLGVTHDVALNIFNKLGGATGAAALLKGVDESEISKLPAEQRDKARIESWANIAGQSALGMLGERKSNAIQKRSTAPVPLEKT